MGRARAAAPRPVVLAVLALVALGACGRGGSETVASDPTSSGPSSSSSPTGGPGGESASPSAPPSASAPAPVGDDSLTVVVSDGGGATRTWTLTCTPDGTPGGDHPDPAGACAALTAMSAPFAPVRKDMMCTQVYGGPETATVQGRWRGQDVSAAFKRTDGCEIARWNRHAALLQPGRAVSRGSSGT